MDRQGQAVGEEIRLLRLRIVWIVWIVWIERLYTPSGNLPQKQDVHFLKKYDDEKSADLKIVQKVLSKFSKSSGLPSVEEVRSEIFMKTKILTYAECLAKARSYVNGMKKKLEKAA